MAYGLRIRNQNGWIQIDENYFNYHLREKGNHLTDRDYGNRGARAVELTVWAQRPVIAIRCDVQAFVERMYPLGNGQWRIQIVTAVNTWIQWYLFDEPQYASLTGGAAYGMRIRNPANNQVAFDSRAKYMRVLGATQGASGQSGPLSYGANVAVVQGCAPAYWSVDPLQSAPDSPWLGVLGASTFRVVGGEVTFGALTLAVYQYDSVGGGFPPDAPPAWTRNNYNYLVINIDGI